MKALILAAGFATRMYPLTKDKAKPLLEIGELPMLTRIADKLSGIEEIDEILVVGNEKFNDQFEAWVASYQGDLPIRLFNDKSTDDSNKLGAIGDIKFTLDQVEGEHQFVVVAGDNLFEFDPAEFNRKFQEHGDPMILVRDIPNKDEKSRYNEVHLDSDNVVTSFREKPADHNSDLAAICFYFFPKGIKGWVDQYLEAGNNPDAPGYFIAWLVQQTRVRAVRFSTTWFDIGNLETLAKARERYDG